MNPLSRRRFLGTSFSLAALSALPLREVFATRVDTPGIHITFDTQGVQKLLDLADAKDASDASLDALLALPAYKNIIRVGEAEESLTRDTLKASAKAVIQGTVTGRDRRQADPARLLITGTNDYRAMLRDLDTTAKEREARIIARLMEFAPESVKKQDITQTIYLHLGGTWDALNVAGDIFLNLHYWHDYNRPSLDGLNLVVAHEMMHTVQNHAYGNPESQADGPGSWLTALSKIQREGTARYVEVETDPQGYAPYTYGFFYRGVDNETLRDFATQLRLLEPICKACFPTFNKDQFATIYAKGMDSGGPLYVAGHGAAKAIDEKAGRTALIETIDKGPKAFWTRYMDLSHATPSLPRLPDVVEAAVKAMPEKLAA